MSEQEQTVQKESRDFCRAVVLALCMFIAVVLHIIGTGVDIIQPIHKGDLHRPPRLWPDNQPALYFSLFKYRECESCDSRDIAQLWCYDLKQYFRAAEAFALLSDLLAILSFLFALAEICGRGAHLVGPILGSVYFLFALIDWAIIAGTFNAFVCDQNLDREHQLSGGFAIIVAADGVALLGVTIWWARYFYNHHE